MAKRIEFDTDSKSLWGDEQSKLTTWLRKFLECGRSFYIEFGFIRRSKTYQQLKGIYRIVKLYAIRLSEFQGEEISEDNAKELLKYKFGITRLANYDEAFKEAMKIRREKELLGQKMSLKDFNFLIEKLQKTFEVPKSFADMSIEEATNLIQEIQSKWFVSLGWSEMELLPEELRKINEYFKQ
jgi:uncharacterized protein YfkK (UPF0435 family)